MEYFYDGEGRRVRKQAGGETTIYVYNILGQLAVEYGTAANPESGPKYLTADHLGSTRVVTDETGGVLSRYDYLPFGEEIAGVYGDRSAVSGYSSADTLNHKFTGKERDAESGLDYFGARFFSGSQGRFTGPDPLMASAKATNPASWHRYAYVLNNPLRHIDPDGLEVPEECARDQKCTIVVKVSVIYDRSVNDGRGLTAEQKKKFEEGQIARAQQDFDTSNIKLEFSYREGAYPIGENRQVDIAGLDSDALNLVVSNRTPTGARGTSFVHRDTDVSITIVNFGEVHDRHAYPLFTNTTVHEFGHQFLGDVYQTRSRNPIAAHFQKLSRETIVDSRVAAQAAGVSQQGFREGLVPRRYAAPLVPEANKPRQ